MSTTDRVDAFTRWVATLAVNPFLPLCLAACGILVALALLPFLAELPNYLETAKTLAEGNWLPANHFAPVGYSLLLSPFVGVFGEAGVVVLQAPLYVISVWLAWTLLRRAEIAPLLVAAGTLIVACHPYLLLNIQRVNDNAVNVALVLVLLLHLLSNRPLPSPGAAIGAGLTLGLFWTIRPNAAVFALLALTTLLLGRVRRPGASRVLLLYGAAVAAWLAVSLLATGTPFFTPRNGPYNLFAGNNPYSAGYLLEFFNAEQSILPGLRDYGITVADPHALDGRTYIELAIDFVTHQPIEALYLLLVKGWILLGPDLSHSDNLAETLIQTGLALPLPIWLAVLALSWRTVPGSVTLSFVLFVLLFIGPFIAITADPRFRLPLDVALVIDTIVRVDALWLRRAERSQGIDHSRKGSRQS